MSGLLFVKYSALDKLKFLSVPRKNGVRQNRERIQSSKWKHMPTTGCERPDSCRMTPTVEQTHLYVAGLGDFSLKGDLLRISSAQPLKAKKENVCTPQHLNSLCSDSKNPNATERLVTVFSKGWVAHGGSASVGHPRDTWAD